MKRKHHARVRIHAGSRAPHAAALRTALARHAESERRGSYPFSTRGRSDALRYPSYPVRWICREPTGPDPDPLIDEVYGEIRSTHPEMIEDPSLKARLYDAYDYARALGFENTQNIIQFLYCEVFAPGFYKSIWIDRWLHHPGSTREQRFADLCAIIRLDEPGPPLASGDDVH